MLLLAGDEAPKVKSASVDSDSQAERIQARRNRIAARMEAEKRKANP